jgi:maltose/maltodextrin transport system permease protein
MENTSRGETAPTGKSATTFPLRLFLGLLFLLPALYLSFLLYQGGQALVGFGFVLVVCLALYVYGVARTSAWRYVFPGLLGFGLFVIFPLVYTVAISFTRYDSSHLLSFDRVRADLLSETYRAGPEIYAYTLFEQEGGEFRALLVDLDREEVRYLSESFALGVGLFGGTGSRQVALLPLADGTAVDGEPLPLAQVTRRQLFIPLRDTTFIRPDGQSLAVEDLRHFTPRTRLFEERPDGTLISQRDGSIVRPDFERGMFVDGEGEKVGFGFRTWTGFDNYKRIFTDPRLRAPFARIFVWTVLFAGISVASTFVLGIVLSVLLQWKELRGRHIYRTLLILPYAVPAVLSILIFQGLFSQEFGAVNEFLRGIFGVAPDWNTNPTMARLMVLLVNLWLGYPYMMLICIGMLQSIPADIYEASAIDGSTTMKDLVLITLPMILPPLLPLLIASFAFNFNNFNLIYLLTTGEPAMVGGGIAGETDILVTYTFSLAFRDSGANYALASAIASILFVIVGTLAWLNLKLTAGRTKAIAR